MLSEIATPVVTIQRDGVIAEYKLAMGKRDRAATANDRYGTGYFQSRMDVLRELWQIGGYPDNLHEAAAQR